MIKVGICGHFGGEKDFLDGQTVKTKTLAAELRRQLGDGEVLSIDTYGGFRKLFSILRSLSSAAGTCENLLILPAHNSVRIFVPLLSLLSHWNPCRLHYIVIGGWLPELLRKNAFLRKRLKRFHGIYVETQTMKTALEGMGLPNIFLLPNCKALSILSTEQLVYPEREPHKLCTFSRVTEEKGVEDAINAVRSVNETMKKTVFSLDIYGPVEQGYREKFKALEQGFPSYIRYCGTVPYEKSVEVLKNYFLLVFPTRFQTEGIPGTIIDAYAAGVPVLCSRWNSFSDLVQEEKTGWGYPLGDTASLAALLRSFARRPQVVLERKKDCLACAGQYSVSRVVEEFCKNLS